MRCGRTRHESCLTPRARHTNRAATVLRLTSISFIHLVKEVQKSIHALVFVGSSLWKQACTSPTETCESVTLGRIHTGASWIYGSVLSIEANYGHWPPGKSHTVVQTRAEERENISWEGGNPDHQGYPSPLLIYLNFHGLARVLPGHLSPHVLPSFTPKNSMQRERFPVVAVWHGHPKRAGTCTHTHTYILTHTHTRTHTTWEGNNPPWSIWPMGKFKQTGIFPTEE